MNKREAIEPICRKLEKTDEKRIERKRKIKRRDADAIIEAYLGFLFPDYFADCDSYSRISLGEKLFSTMENLLSHEVVADIFLRLPHLRAELLSDATAIYTKDPAARSVEEIILAYPGFYAVAIYRFAHIFYLNGDYTVSRLLSEIAHGRTGIDIHPGAEIGSPFAIDHGTGIVIGESAKIGNNVRIYHGVTIGAISILCDESGEARRGEKRHPTIEDGVTIYANATILGGDTMIGEGSVIGSNLTVTSSLSAGSILKLK